MQKGRNPQLVNPDMLLDTMAEGVVVLDTEGRIQLWNEAMHEITGYSAAEANGQSMEWLRAPDCINSQQIGELMRSQVENSVACLNGCECRVISRSGEVVPVLVNARAIRDENETVIGVLNTITDVRPVELLRSEVTALRSMIDSDERFQGMVGRSAAMQEVFRLVELAAASDATVLIQGESGTGKELAAAAIQRLSTRSEMPMVSVNCGSLSDSLLESELFGHVKGAFTGAHRDRLGRFESAEGGTLFLDEVGEISPAMQVKLLRVLQQGEFQRVGESTTRRCDVRIIAATNRDLVSEVRNATFREDLYYRLRVFPLTIPSLRSRRDDVPLLIEHFVRRFSRRTEKNIHGLTAEAINAARGYPWPGNIRELENAIEYAFVVCQGSAISVSDLPPELRGQPVPLYAESSAPLAPTAVATRRHNDVLRDAIALRATLQENGWNKAATARALGVSHTAVWKWMKRHDMPLKQPARQSVGRRSPTGS